jgi:hypothetical protein
MRILLWAGVSAIVAGSAMSQPALVVDGTLEDPFWRGAERRTFAPQETGAPADFGGQTQAGIFGSNLCVSARLPEPGGRVNARSFGRNPVWEKDALESPEVEDRVDFELRYRDAGGATRKVSLAINPWGAYRAETQLDGLMPAARIDRAGWTVEAAIPLAALNPGADAIQVRVQRIRARRPLAPEYRWESQHTIRAIAQAAPQPPGFRPPQLGNTEAPLEIGRVARLPEVTARWDDPAWRDTPAFELARNEAYPRRPRHPTQIKWMHDGRARTCGGARGRPRQQRHGRRSSGDLCGYERLGLSRDCSELRGRDSRLARDRTPCHAAELRLERAR